MRDAAIVLTAVLATASFAVADPPPFGTVIQTWQMVMSGPYAAAGLAWRQDSGLLYVLDQGFSGSVGVWKLDPADPPGSIRADSWVLANLGSGARDIPFGIAWDQDSGCFWLNQAVDGSVYAGCYLVRMAWQDGAWVWRGTPADSWRIDSAPAVQWMAGFAEWTDLGYFLGSAVGPGDTFGHLKLDPYTKRRLGFIPTGSLGRGTGLIPADSFHIITVRWDSCFFAEWDTLGSLRRQSPPVPHAIADVAMIAPRRPAPGDTVFFFSTSSDENNTLLKVSTGLLWGQLRAGQAVVAEPGRPTPAGRALRVEPNPCPGLARLRSSMPPGARGRLSVLDVSGRAVLVSAVVDASFVELDLRAL